MRILSFRIVILSLTLINTVYGQPNQRNIHDGVEHITISFDNYDIVAIGETHDKVEVTDFYIELVKNEAFRKKVDFIVIEMGNHLFQPVLDDYLNGKKVKQSELYKLWRDHTSCMLNSSDNTGLIRLLSAIKEVNVSSKYKLNVLAGDPNIDWKEIKCLQQFYKYLGKRDEYYTDIVEKFIVNKSKKALLVMGNSHFNKQKTASMIDNNLNNPITSLIPKMGDDKLHLINILSAASFPYDKVRSTGKGNIITTKDEWLGNLKVGSPFIKDFPLKKQTDAVLYLGEKDELTKESITPFNDKDYKRELERRNNLEKCN